MPIAFNGSGTISGISTGGISDAKAVADAAMPAGSIIQVVQGVKTDVSSLSVATTALSSDIVTVTITPQSTSSKILLYGLLNAACSTIGVGFVFQRDSTDTGRAAANGSRQRRTTANYANTNTIASVSGFFLDSPSTTSAITYRLKACHTSANTQTITVNDNSAGNQAKFINTICTLIAMEVAE
tara:strand:+ start:67 stop:618 length:552 start_codon:yes stop_codon:yes gene_type:complete